jgi:hypothetical protein
MKRLRYILMSIIVLGIAGFAGAAGPVTLTSAGDLYSVSTRDNQVVVTARYADGTSSELFIPQSAAAVEDSLQVGVDENTGALYVLWQKMTGMESRLRIAGYVDGTWIGPFTFAGNDGTAAFNPEFMIHRATTMITEEAAESEEAVVTELSATVLHLVWWSQVSEEDAGVAQYAALPVTTEGLPQFAKMERTALTDFLPYGIVCFDITGGDNLKHPKLLMDPKTGNPHIFATDFANCVFQIFELRPEVVDDEAEVTKRRRQIIILRRPSTIALRPDLPLGTATLVVGGGLKMIIHWDGDLENTLQYLELDEEGESGIKTLLLDELVNHERAVDLIRDLTN